MCKRPKQNTGMLFNIALNYGGRAEIVDAPSAPCSRHRPADPGMKWAVSFLYTADSPMRFAHSHRAGKCG